MIVVRFLDGRIRLMIKDDFHHLIKGDNWTRNSNLNPADIDGWSDIGDCQSWMLGHADLVWKTILEERRKVKP